MNYGYTSYDNVAPGKTQDINLSHIIKINSLQFATNGIGLCFIP